MRRDDLRLLTAALVLLLTGAFLTTPAKADERPTHCAFGRRSAPPPAAHKDGPDRATGGGHRTVHTGRTARWTAPTVGYRLSARYAAKGRLWKHRHTGQDFAVDTGTPVYAVGPGSVVAATCGDAFGNQVVLHHPDGYYTQYAHLSVINVRRGQHVSTGQRIGAAGSTGNAEGPHLHFEVRTTRHLGSEVPPLPWLRQHGVSVPAKPSPAHLRPTPGASATASVTTTAVASPASSPATAKPSARGTTVPPGHRRPARPHRTTRPQVPPAPQATPLKHWIPASVWDPATLWDLTARRMPGTQP
ncbi:M23 family metallopeptidase [Streptomyces sp. Ag109_O5-10]|uniref:M23 family metallopeptidase n=1 Tax=Streptomyces sp. Ag109_O5-10 TaxID=1855349 RepID=UPI00089A9E1A|nr:M23 family metallopeptidase [Streptomyces sp. Ag109_O5-10]SEE88295.1 Peptidase family M23 [Streptomyces sp. Ag109_O5-10]